MGRLLRITEHRTSDRLVLKLEGRVSGELVSEVNACWRAALEAGAESVSLDLTDVCLVDAAGQALFARMHRQGVRFLTRGCVMRELVREISEL